MTDNGLDPHNAVLQWARLLGLYMGWQWRQFVYKNKCHNAGGIPVAAL